MELVVPLKKVGGHNNLMRSPPTQKVKTCSYCTDYKGHSKIILPEKLPDAIRMPNGSYKCQICQNEELKDRIVRVIPNSDRAKEILAEREIKKNRRVI